MMILDDGKVTFDSYFRDMEMEGMESEGFDFGDGCGSVDYYAAFEIMDADRAAYPDDIGTLDTHVVIHHDNQGFTDVYAVAHADMVALRSEHEAFCAERDSAE